MQDHRFLTVAVWAGRLSPEQAREIYFEQCREGNLHGVHQMVGERAIAKRFMTREAVALTLQDQLNQRKENSFYRDIVAESSLPISERPSFDPETLNRVRAGAGFGILALLVLCWYISNHNWEAVARVGDISAATWLAAELIAPLLLNRKVPKSKRIAWKRLPERIIPVLFLAACSYLASLVAQLQANQSGNLPPPGIPYRSLLAIGIILTMYLLTYCAGVWRRKRIYFFQARSDLMRILVTATETGVANRANNDPDEPTKSLGNLIEVAASIMQLDPWGQAVAKLTSRQNRVIPASLWYYEPEPDDSGFRIKAWSAPGAPTDVLQTFAEIAENYRALRHDDEWFKQCCESCSRNGEVDEALYAREFGSKMKTSLVGWTYQKASALTSDNPRSRLVFNRDHEDVVENAKKDEMIASWLVVDFFGCCPVFDPASLDSSPIGVLILLKNSGDGITREDRSALATTAAMIGFLLSKGPRDEELRTDSH